MLAQLLLLLLFVFAVLKTFWPKRSVALPTVHAGRRGRRSTSPVEVDPRSRAGERSSFDAPFCAAAAKTRSRREARRLGSARGFQDAMIMRASAESQTQSSAMPRRASTLSTPVA